MLWIVAGIIIVFLLVLVVFMCEKAAEDQDLMHLHPPDDDDGVSLREDPDGQYSR